MDNLNAYKPEVAKAKLLTILTELTQFIETHYEETPNQFAELGNEIMFVLDAFDEEDFFGTEGWEHTFGLED